VACLVFFVLCACFWCLGFPLFFEYNGLVFKHLLMTSSGDNMEMGGLKTAQEVLELFYGRYGVDRIKLVLLGSFQAYALNEKKVFLELGFGEREVAEVFDGLVDLVAAVRVLMEEGKIEGVGVEGLKG